MRDDINLPPLPEGYRWEIQKYHMHHIQNHPPGDYLAVLLEELQTASPSLFDRLFHTQPNQHWTVLSWECVYPNPPTPALIEEAAERLLAKREDTAKQSAEIRRKKIEEEKLRGEHSKSLDEFTGVY